MLNMECGFPAPLLTRLNARQSPNRSIADSVCVALSCHFRDSLLRRELSRSIPRKIKLVSNSTSFPFAEPSRPLNLTPQRLKRILRQLLLRHAHRRQRRRRKFRQAEYRQTQSPTIRAESQCRDRTLRASLPLPSCRSSTKSLSAAFGIAASCAIAATPPSTL